MLDLVWIELDSKGQPVRIFKSASQCANAQRAMPLNHSVDRVNPLWAVGKIRDAVLRRQRGRCLKCDGEISKVTMHLDEVKSRGRGGLISLDNCQALCSDCHIGPRGKHGLERSPRFRSKG